MWSKIQFNGNGPSLALKALIWRETISYKLPIMKNVEHDPVMSLFQFQLFGEIQDNIGLEIARACTLSSYMG